MTGDRWSGVSFNDTKFWRKGDCWGLGGWVAGGWVGGVVACVVVACHLLWFRYSETSERASGFKGELLAEVRDSGFKEELGFSQTHFFC